METNELKEILRKHKMWLKYEEGGERANLRRAYLRRADLSFADLRKADLTLANLSGADLSGADLSFAYLSGADLSGTDLSGADLSGAKLSGTDLSGADIDYSSFPLSCKGLHIHLDDRIGIQLLYHAISNILFSKNTSDELKEQVSALVDVANKFHRVEECGNLKPFNKEDTNNE